MFVVSFSVVFHFSARGELVFFSWSCSPQKRNSFTSLWRLKAFCVQASQETSTHVRLKVQPERETTILKHKKFGSTRVYSVNELRWRKVGRHPGLQAKTLWTQTRLEQRMGYFQTGMKLWTHLLRGTVLWIRIGLDKDFWWKCLQVSATHFHALHFTSSLALHSRPAMEHKPNRETWHCVLANQDRTHLPLLEMEKSSPPSPCVDPQCTCFWERNR